MGGLCGECRGPLVDCRRCITLERHADAYVPQPAPRIRLRPKPFTVRASTPASRKLRTLQLRHDLRYVTTADMRRILASHEMQAVAEMKAVEDMWRRAAEATPPA